MFQPMRISPSILSADFMDMGREVAMIEAAGADWVHVDVMDGHFVPNLTMGVPLVRQLKRTTNLPLDVHLMISNPLVQIPWFLDAGADLVTFHVEAAAGDEARKAIETVHASGALAGISIKPGTPVSAIEPFMADIDMVLVMSVEPGFSGQSYIAGSEDKVAEVCRIARGLAQAREALGREVEPLVQVDGGIGTATLERVVAAGANVLVCGNAVFAAEDPASALGAIKAQASEVRAAHAARLKEGAL